MRLTPMLTLFIIPLHGTFHGYVDGAGCKECSNVKSNRIDVLVDADSTLRTSTKANDYISKSRVFLIRTPNVFAVFDLGIAGSVTEMMSRLNAMDVSPGCMDFVIKSHEHPDHIGASSEFAYEAIFMSSTWAMKGDRLCQHDLFGLPAGSSRKLDEDLYLVLTPGGDSSLAWSLVVQNAELYGTKGQLLHTGTIALVGDLLELDHFENNTWTTTNAKPDGANKLDSIAAIICRDKGANTTYILPGHGACFEVTDAMRAVVQDRCNAELNPAQLTLADCSSDLDPPLTIQAITPVMSCPTVRDSAKLCTDLCVSKPRIDVLVESNGFKVTSESVFDAHGAATVHLVRTPSIITMMDLGWPSAAEIILSALDMLNVSTSCMDYAISSHSHADHTGTQSLFISDTMFVNEASIFKGTSTCQHTLHMEPHGAFQSLDDYITLVRTPGDTLDGISMVVKKADVYNTTQDLIYSGTVALVGDLIMFKDMFVNGIWQTAGAIPNATVKMESIAALICTNGANSSYVLPGHGPGFEVTNAMRNAVENLCNFPFHPRKLDVVDCSQFTKLNFDSAKKCEDSSNNTKFEWPHIVLVVGLTVGLLVLVALV